MTELLDGLRARLLDNAFLFDDPAAYRAGVMDTFDALASEPTSHVPARRRPRSDATAQEGVTAPAGGTNR